MTETNLKQILGDERAKKLSKPILGLLKEQLGVKTSILLNVDDEDDNIIRIIEHHENPSIQIDLEEIQVTSETKGYEPTGYYNWKPIEILNFTPKSELIPSTYFITVDSIFLLENVLISKETEKLSFNSAKLL